ncbi:F-box/LRR-repeat protein 7-like isoform X1 [Amphibalanus amphitrite]|uniref:F-box/LRR-repeat protein 7-like isoform X1 n=2 Tax=Amphibalanus amphitrite TaxID=1232801 RepID=UPI001C911F00|nr:F-box/LRR-repeat protein 7-like isoform X1 [Amphibalanus amphitrite]
MGAGNGRPLTDTEGRAPGAGQSQDSDISLSVISTDCTDFSASPPRSRRDPSRQQSPLGAGPGPRIAALPSLHDIVEDVVGGALSAELRRPLTMDPLSVPAPSPPFDMATVAAALPGHPGLVRARADAETGLGGRMSPSVYNHKLVPAAHGRASPAYDLGYHTLVARPSAPSPRQQPSPWGGEPPQTAACYPAAAMPSFSVREPPRPPQLPEPPSSNELILTMFKGKRTHKPAPFDRLPDELILHIFSYLSTNELCFCARVCRRWYFLVWEPQLWTSITLTGETTGADRALRQIVKLLCRDTPGTLCHTVERVELNGCARLTDRGLSLLARRCPQLRHLELRGCANVSNQALFEVVTNCPGLEHLDVTGCHRITCIDFSSEALAGSERQLCLQYIDLTDCHSLTDAGLQVIVHNCPQLQHLYMRRCDQLTDLGIRHVPSYCVSLREFSISDCSRVTDYGLHELARLGPTLRYLSVAKCDRVSDAGVKQVARSCYKLRYLNVRGCEAVSDASMEVVARCCQRLRALDIGKCDVTDHGLKMLSQNCPNLKKLSVKSCEMISDAGIKFIAYYCRGLQQLNIQDSPVTLEGYRTVKKYCKRCIIEHTNPGFY